MHLFNPLYFRRSAVLAISLKRHYNLVSATSVCPSCFCSKYNVNNSKLSRSIYTAQILLTNELSKTHQTLTKQQASELVYKLTDEERTILLSSLQEFQSKIIKDEYEGQLAASRWRSRFGRPSKLPTLGDVDPTGSYCPVPEDWLMRKYAESVPRPTAKELLQLSIANSVPFVGFGFLDNFFMLIAGDYIDLYLGSYLVLTTMGAAALGNTLSDILGIGTAFYVERAAIRIGIKAPNLTPIQLDMKSSRRCANLGRVLGVTIGCFLGMFPLLFLKKRDTNDVKAGD